MLKYIHDCGENAEIGLTFAHSLTLETCKWNDSARGCMSQEPGGFILALTTWVRTKYRTYKWRAKTWLTKLKQKPSVPQPLVFRILLSKHSSWVGEKRCTWNPPVVTLRRHTAHQFPLHPGAAVLCPVKRNHLIAASLGQEPASPTQTTEIVESMLLWRKLSIWGHKFRVQVVPSAER